MFTKNHQNKAKDVTTFLNSTFFDKLTTIKKKKIMSTQQLVYIYSVCPHKDFTLLSLSLLYSTLLYFTLSSPLFSSPLYSILYLYFIHLCLKQVFVKVRCNNLFLPFVKIYLTIFNQEIFLAKILLNF